MIEGFTTVFESKLTGILHSDWRSRDFFNLNILQLVFKDDQSNTAPAVSELVETLDEIQGIFGPIAYEKAGSILRMFENAIGAQYFQDALRSYVTANHHKTVIPADLHVALEDVLKQNNFVEFNFTQSFLLWELQKGYPVIHVTFNQPLKQFKITQKRFYIDPDMVDESDNRWTIPLSFATSKNQNFDDTKFTHYFEHGIQEMIIETDDEPEWFVFNKQQLGYYRVDYDNENWLSLIAVLNTDDFTQIHVLNRAQLVDDSLSFAKAGLIDYEIASGILKYLRSETDYFPWASASSYLNDLSEIFGGRSNNLNVTSLKLTSLEF